DLLGDDTVELAAADREVGVAEVRRPGREYRGHPVGPPAQAVGRGRVRVADPFGEGVTERDVAVVGHGGEPRSAASSLAEEVGVAGRGRWSRRAVRPVTRPKERSAVMFRGSRDGCCATSSTSGGWALRNQRGSVGCGSCCSPTATSWWSSTPGGS